MLVVSSCSSRQARSVNIIMYSVGFIRSGAHLLFVSPSCSSVDVMEEAKKLIGTGKRHLVMGDVVSAVNVFQDACSVL